MTVMKLLSNNAAGTANPSKDKALSPMNKEKPSRSVTSSCDAQLFSAAFSIISHIDMPMPSHKQTKPIKLTPLNQRSDRKAQHTTSGHCNTNSHP
eukprot:CAMPEP_0169148756 /NCGR_PEP_ID=MMETSP1015-20121227/49070_1 /TAXON_ID=342587 /ORGANISM="Karlodinium micrum, Strain CCMP2283" /LENGTH=94 /DNA_ID=CAMNT_0009217345 /DNA_START=17 /DNA_END=298 /DNA_ORIENTATION=-